MNDPEPALSGEPAPAPGGPVFEVVINHERQYAIWPAEKPLPPKWSKAGIARPRDECLTYVRQIWQDMRPLSVRDQHEAGTARRSDDRPIP